MKDWFSWFTENDAKITQVGSRVTCDPPVMDTDEDWLIYVPEQGLANWLTDAAKLGFDLDDRCKHYRVEDNDFNSWRGPNNLNLIVTASLQFYNKFNLASNVAKELNLLKKEDRITLFQANLYGREPKCECMATHEFPELQQYSAATF